MNKLYLLSLIQLAISAPLLVTRVHTAAPVTVEQTYTTGTTTVYLPPVQILISNGQTFTSTMTESPAGVPATFTSVVNDQPTEQPQPEQTADETPAQPEQTPAQQEQTQTQQEQTQTQAQTPAQTPTQTAAETPAQTSVAPSTTPTTLSTSNTQQTTTEAQTQAETPTQEKQTEQTADANVNSPWGIVYSPYADNGDCKDQNTIFSDIEFIHSKGINHIRTYATDCNTLTAVLPKAKQLGMSVNQGLWMSQDGVDSIDSQVSDLVTYIQQNGDSVFDFITIGNEAIIQGFASVNDLLAKIQSVKSTLQAAGYNGKVTTAEPPVSFDNNPSLCDGNSPIDFVSINPHSYFNADIGASDAGSFVMGQKSLVESSCPNKNVVITETGYPSQGNTNGQNVPSAANQQIAIKSILDLSGGDVTILTTYNDFWKQPGPYGIEQFFGAINLFN